MIRNLKTIAVMLAIGCAIAACGDDKPLSEPETPPQEQPDDDGKDEEEPGKDEEDEKPEPIVSITPIGQLNQAEEELNSHAGITGRSSIRMNYRTYTEVPKNELYEPNQQYPRIKKMADGRFIMFYQKGSSKSSGIGQRCHWAISSDLTHWEHKGDVFTTRTLTTADGQSIKRYYANCDAVVLKNGDILAVASYRGDNYKVNTQWDGVELRRSTDNGQTWGDYQEIYKGGVTWEPYIIELASGEIHCYFTDSNRTGLDGHGQDTGVAMVTSSDGGKTWNPAPQDEFYEPYYVLRMAWEANGERMFNHQMPCIIQLNNSNELAAVMESHPGDEDYHISMAWSGEDGQWEHLAAGQEGPEDSENMLFLGSAPYLMQFPSGETLLSYNRGGFHLKMGDATARHFAHEPYDPFKGSFWGSLCLMDSHRAIGTIPHESDESIIVAQFILNHRIEAIPRETSVDGDNKEWQDTDHALFVGDKSQAQATLRAACHEDSLYFLAEVLDQNLSTSGSDYISLYITPDTESGQLNDKALRINIAANGLKNVETYRNGQWTETDRQDLSIETTKCDRAELSSKERGYIAEIGLPKDALGINGDEVLVNFSISRNYGEQDALATRSSTGTEEWIPIGGLDGR